MKTFLMNHILWPLILKATKLAISYGKLMEDGAVPCFLLLESLKRWNA